MPFTAYLYAFYLSFCTKMQCILHQNTLRLAPKRVAFSGKTQCILHQNTLRFGAYCTIFSSKWPLKQCKWQFLQINIHFTAFTVYLLFTSKQTFARIDFLRPSGQLVDKKVTFCVKKFAKKLTKRPYPSSLGEGLRGVFVTYQRRKTARLARHLCLKMVRRGA